tara:strand:+ start:2117 stop:2797 length:681 start_codon:yes stop_codon:yes gene_type:complete
MNKLNHVAIIMDGNGRWGLKRKKNRNYGHLKGIKSVETVIKSSIKNKISYLTLYTFSTENWKRPENEINFLFDLIRKSLKKNIKKIIKQGIKINVIGSNKGLPADIKRTVKYIERKTIENKTITLNLALNYGSKEEIINALKNLVRKKNKEINIRNFEEELYTKNIPDPEVLIRTGGTKRLSNFLLWQLAYTEIFFINKLWPDFNENDFNDIVKKFYKIKRNFGKI